MYERVLLYGSHGLKLLMKGMLIGLLYLISFKFVPTNVKFEIDTL